MSPMVGLTSLPMSPGLEVAGVVQAAGTETGFNAGDELMGYTGFSGGGFAEYVAVDPRSAALKPSSLSFAEAAALVAGAGTAYEGLVDRLELQRDERILITGASGGVGTMAVQIAAAVGARVFGVASGGNIDYVRGLGAEEVFDYNQPGWSETALAASPGGVDALFEGVGGEAGEEALKAVRAGGRASFIALPTPQIDPGSAIAGEFFLAGVTRERLEAIAALVSRGQLRVELAGVFPLEQAREALERVRGGHTRGKVVLVVD
jgi:NADPH2:quinone reductase